MKKEAVLLDMDGVLVDSEGYTQRMIADFSEKKRIMILISWI